MPSSKDRLYVALYARGGMPKMSTFEDTYHWALIVGPKTEDDKKRGTQFHAKEMMMDTGNTQWMFEERDISLHATNMILVRITVGKIKNGDRLRGILHTVPIRQEESGWNCISWVQEALKLLQADGDVLGTSAVEWEEVRDAAMTYCDQKKRAHRFDGQGGFDMTWPPTFDLMKKREIIP